MLNRDRFLFVHGADPDAWAKRWGIDPLTTSCYECGQDRTTTLPFAVNGMRGLVAPPCPCGNENGPYCVVAAEGGDILSLFQHSGAQET